MNIAWEPLRQIIDAHERFFISSHVRPDADAIGSALGLACLLEQRGKHVIIANPSAPPANLQWIDPNKKVRTFGHDLSPDDLKDVQVHIVVDTSGWQQLGDIGRWMKSTPVVRAVIDHHVSSDDLGAMEFKDTVAEATGTLIFRFSQFLGATFTLEAANALYAAIATDTGWFRFPATTSETMRIVGHLMDLGVKPAEIYRHLYEQATLSRVRLMGRILGRVSLDCGGRLASAWVAWDDFMELGAVPADTEDLVNECLKIAGTRAAFIAIEQQNRQVKVSFRSRTDMNVAAVAETFQGGGHKQAAGATLSGPLQPAYDRVLSAMKAAVEASTPAT